MGRLRLEKAKHLLALTELTVTEIYLEVGFESLGSFMGEQLSKEITMESKKTFFDAIKNGDMEKVNEVLDQDSGLLQARTETGITPILLAMFYGHRDVGEQLVERSASLDIFEASAVGNEACSRELLDNQPELANA